MMTQRQAAALDEYITGHYGEDSVAMSDQQETFDPLQEANEAIDRALSYREKRKDPTAWFTLAFAALRIFALFVSSYIKRDK